MRDKFELNCKTVGLVFFCIGAYYTLTAVPLFFHKEPDVTKMMPQDTLKFMSQSDLTELKTAMSYTWKYALRMLFLTGLAPMLGGFYLMRSNNLFVRLCYPEHGGKPPLPSTGTGDAVKSDTAPKSPGRINDKKPGSKYAPPGYFE